MQSCSARHFGNGAAVGFNLRVLRVQAAIAIAAGLLALAGIARAQDSSIKVDVARARTATEIYRASDTAVKDFNRNVAALTKNSRDARARAGRYDPRIPLSMPMRVVLTAGGRVVPAARTLKPYGATPGLNLIFDTTGPNAFSDTYKNFLIDVYNAARPFINATFGNPAVSGDVHVRNYDATMGDRDVVAGGYYVPNGPDGPEIRFPVYSSGQASETVAVNFLHTLLLAYQGPTPYAYDAFQEGLVRAATMRIARQNGALPAGLDPGIIEAVLDNTYDASSFYDWYNQRALGGSKFIAPNLRDTQLPIGGSIGGLYLLRYQMAGSAWQKVLVEYPGFIATFNQAFYQNPSLAGDVPGLVSLAQTTINNVGGGNTTVEGLSFADWFRRQYILETKNTMGPKLLVEPVPITSGLGGTDFGVFIVQANWFETTAGGNEILLSGTSYPIFWEGETLLNRVFPSSQEDRMDIGGAYGAVGPNFPDLNGGQPYRVTVDLPVADQLQRVYLPAGAIATASNPSEKDFYGTVVGVTRETGDTLRVRINVNGTQLADVPVQNDAFGTTIGTASFLGYAKVTVSVVLNHNGADDTVLTRVVDKGPGALALDLRVNGEGTYTFPFALPKGIAMVGFPVDPFASLNSDVLGTAPAQTLVARYDSAKARYVLFPDVEPFKIGHGYFVRSENAESPFMVDGRFHRKVEMSVALKPGWNMIASPITDDVPTSRVRVVRAADFPQAYSEALGVDLGLDFFSFTPGAVDPATGAPETGTMTVATTFEQGKAYFVRVLAPEGVTLVFAPPPGTLAHVAQSISPRVTVVPPSGWKLGVKIQHDRFSSQAILGQSRSATRGFDPAEDSGLPPGIGGLQVVLENLESLYRDIRALGSAESYRVRLEGLQRGKEYKVTFPMISGRLDRFSLYDGAGRFIRSMSPGGVYTFVATGTTQGLEMRVSGGTR
jgi:hypothetical protein